MIMQATSWYVAQLKPNAARVAERNLVRQGFAAFMPMIERNERKEPRFQRMLRPVVQDDFCFGIDPQGGGRRASFVGQATLPVSGNLMKTLRNNADADGVFRRNSAVRERSGRLRIVWGSAWVLGDSCLRSFVGELPKFSQSSDKRGYANLLTAQQIRLYESGITK